MRRIRLTVSYDGTEFHGWQVQPGLPTIQAHLEEVFSAVEKKPVHVAGSGRTDAGVHAIAQTAAVTLENPIPVRNLKKAVNRLLPPAIRVMECEEVELGFHPRFDAVSKTYEYRIWRGETVSPFHQHYVHHHPFPMSDDAFCAAARLFVGEHDFFSFAASDERYLKDDRNTIRTVFSSEARRDGDLLVYRVTGSGFLKHMVRNIVGTLIEVAKGNVDEDHVRWLLTSPPGAKAIPTAPARGLFLMEVHY